MANRSKQFTYYLEEDTRFWQILVKKNDTISRGGKIGQKGKVFSTKSHANATEAKKYAQKQMKSKVNAGFTLKKENVAAVSPKSKNKSKNNDKEKGEKSSTTGRRQNVSKAKKSRMNREATVVLARDKSMMSREEKRELLKRPTQFGNWSLSRIPSLTVGAEELYVPSRNDWPVSIDAPIVWHCDSPYIKQRAELRQSDYAKFAYGIYVDDTKCLFGSEGGNVFELNHEGKIVRIYELHKGVKCIVKDGDFLYVGCNDGGLYDLSNGEARLVYGGFASFGQVCWLDIWQGYVAMSDEHGQLAMVDHEGELMWKKQSPGVGGWMVRLDHSGVYHGYCGGVSKYHRQDGTPLWSTSMDVNSSVYFGVQDKTSLFVAESAVVRKIDKETGQIVRTYQKENCGEIISNEVGPEMIFAGGDFIACYDERTAETIYKLSYQMKPYSMKYHKGRLYCVGEGGLNVIDLTEDVVKSYRRGEAIRTHQVSTKSLAKALVSPLKRVESISTQENQSHVLLKCVRINNRLRVKPVSDAFNVNWNVQFPLDIRKEGAMYVVERLVPSEEGCFYRVYGTIQELESA